MSSFSDSVLQVSMAAFDKASGATNVFVAPLLIARFAYANVTGSQSLEYSSAIKGVILYFVLITGFEPILRILLILPEHFVPEFSLDVFKSVKETQDASSSVLGLVPSVLTWTLESLVAVLYYAAMFLNFAVAVLMAAMAPIIFLLGAILGIGLGVRTFFGLLVTVCAWPVVFAACESLHALVIPMTDGGLGALVFDLLITVFKLAGPLALAFLGLNSGAGQALMATLTAGFASATVLANHSESFTKGVTGKDNSHVPRSLSQYGSLVTRTAAHTAGQGVRNLSKRINPKDDAKKGAGNISSQDKSSRSANQVQANRDEKQAVANSADIRNSRSHASDSSTRSDKAPSESVSTKGTISPSSFKSHASHLNASPNSQRLTANHDPQAQTKQSSETRTTSPRRESSTRSSRMNVRTSESKNAETKKD